MKLNCPDCTTSALHSYIFAYQIEPERLATWKSSAEWYVPSSNTHLIKVPIKKVPIKYNRQPQEQKQMRHFSGLASQKERDYVRQELDQLIFSKDISLTRIAEMAGISKSSLYDMYRIDRQHVRNRKTMFNKLYQTFPQIEPFNRESQSPKQREVMWYEI